VHESVVLDEVAVLYDVAVLDEVFVTTMVASEVALLGEATAAVELAVEELEEAAVFEEAMAAAAEANAVPIPPRSLLAAVSDRTGLLGAGEVVVDGGRLFPSVVRQRVLVGLDYLYIFPMEIPKCSARLRSGTLGSYRNLRKMLCNVIFELRQVGRTPLCGPEDISVRTALPAQELPVDVQNARGLRMSALDEAWGGAGVQGGDGYCVVSDADFAIAWEALVSARGIAIASAHAELEAEVSVLRTKESAVAEAKGVLAACAACAGGGSPPAETELQEAQQRLAAIEADVLAAQPLVVLKAKHAAAAGAAQGAALAMMFERIRTGVQQLYPSSTVNRL
jgi:hypothetical protein